MNTSKNKNEAKKLKPVGNDFFVSVWEKSWIYIKTVVDVVREPILILDKNLCVMVANEPFYKLFQVEKKDTEEINVYALGNGQWNIPSLRKLLEEILPKNTFFNGFEVAHDFPSIGRKMMILNGRQIHFEGDSAFEPIIMLAMEDVTGIMAVADSFTAHANLIETKLLSRTQKMEAQIEKLEKQLLEVQRKSDSLK